MNPLPAGTRASGNKLFIPSADIHHMGDYYCVIDSPSGLKPSNPGRLTVTGDYAL